MTRANLIARLASRHKLLGEADVSLAVKTILGSISSALSDRRRVEIRGFGSFSAQYRAARAGRNPRSGEAIQQSAMYRPHFKASKRLRERINSGDSGKISAPHSE